MFAIVFSIILWLFYFCFAKLSTLFSCVSFLFSIWFSYWLAEELVFQRQTDPQINYILVNPNAIVYCTFYLFISCRFVFSIIYFTFLRFPYLKVFFSKETFLFYCFSIAFLFFLFFFSYIIVDRDISNTFLLRQPKSVLFDINTIDQAELVYSFTTRPWEFSLYFFQFFGIFFDFFVTFSFMYSLFILFWWINCNFYTVSGFKSIKNQSDSWFNRKSSHPLFSDFRSHKLSFFYINKFSWWIRRCIFIVSFYFYSGESFVYDRLVFSFIFCFIEISLFFNYLIRSLYRLSKKILSKAILFFLFVYSNLHKWAILIILCKKNPNKSKFSTLIKIFETIF